MTLMEVIVTLGIAASTVSISMPTVQRLRQASRVADRVDSIVGDLRYARMQAMKRGHRVTVCASRDGQACLADGAGWHEGWIVFEGSAGDPDIAARTKLRVQPHWTGSDVLLSSTVPLSIGFSEQGYAIRPDGPATLTLRTTPADAASTRCITVQPAGRPSVRLGGTGGCA